MRNIFFFFLFFGCTGLVAAASSTDPVVCTLEYAPVCGTVQVQCIKAPCNPVRETFGNTCMAAAAKATNITTGECPTTPVVGGDLDEHGCKASAGYSWDSTLRECIRVWEKPQTLVTWAYENALTRYADTSSFAYERPLTRQEAAAIMARAAEKVWGLKYASYPDVCNIRYSDETHFDSALKNDVYSACAFDLMRGQRGVFAPTRTLSRAEALAIIMRGVDGGKKDESGSMWYQNYADRAHELGILSFANFHGFDQAITRGELLEWVYVSSKYMKEKNANNILVGDWVLQKFNSTVINDSRYTLNITTDRISAKFCNNVSGAYSAKNNVFSAPMLMSTKMYCEGIPMTLENAFTLDSATYTVSGTIPDLSFTVTTGKGDIFVYKHQ